ncbi:fructoselysine-6-phosphate deglycase [Fontibacillus phaseoli]|uniref:Fructosamine deglycase n=1 Tax=Fontibacillus phaseoli TaxID=1416533 RepID=A0A369B9B0_9BACL|nr:SIS domain-containing protein [Fontibacillus phaseoli]RCX18113.1 fructoselysine-6-phosphate deglycase [Fontibacillus phaseoli]
MFNFNEDNFRKVTKGAVGLRGQIEEIGEKLTARGYKNLFLIGSGGSIAIMYPFEYMIKTTSTLPVYAEIAAEFVLYDHKQFGPDSLVILSSLSGTTKETVEAAKFCKDKGATTIGLVGELGTPLADLTDYTLVNYSENDTASDSIYLQLYLLIFKLLAARGEFPEYARFADELEAMPEVLLDVKRATEGPAEAFVNKYKDETYHMLIGSGSVWGETYSYAMCVLEEMQWIRTKSVHAAEFFHGTLELVERDTSMILMTGEDESRPLMERVERFARKYTDKLSIFDTKEYELKGISDQFRKYLSPLIIASLFERVSVQLEAQRNHPLSTRRYYRTVEY